MGSELDPVISAVRDMLASIGVGGRAMAAKACGLEVFGMSKTDVIDAIDDYLRGLQGRSSTLERLWDNDGDEWVRREDGWCCQGLCDCTGESKPHSCDEHNHFPEATVSLLFGPLSTVKPNDKP